MLQFILLVNNEILVSRQQNHKQGWICSIPHILKGRSLSFLLPFSSKNFISQYSCIFGKLISIVMKREGGSGYVRKTYFRKGVGNFVKVVEFLKESIDSIYHLFFPIKLMIFFTIVFSNVIIFDIMILGRFFWMYQIKLLGSQ